MYYHFSPVPLMIGKKLKHTGINYCVSGKIEKILEANRPKENFPRNQSVYAVREKSFDRLGLTYNSGFIHIVSVCGKIDQRDCGWIGELQKRNWPHPDWPIQPDLNMSDLSDEEVARNYWQGASTENPNWEFVSQNVRVLWRLFGKRNLLGKTI